MNIEQMKSRFVTVCEAPNGNGFHVEHLPELLHDDPLGNSTPHIHTFYEILWFQEGRGTHTVDFNEYEVKPNSLFFLVPGQVHHFDSNRDYRGITIKMCTDFLRVEDNFSALFLKYNAFHTFDTAPYYTINEDTAQELKQLVNLMEDEACRGGEFGNVEILKSLLRIFLVKIQRHGIHEGEFRLNNLKPSHRLFVLFRRMVEQEYTRMHTVQEYADRLNVAVRTLNKSVNECSNKTPLTFINDRIMLEAKRQLRYTNMMVKEIAYDLGYEDPSYFVKLFKRHTGYLPGDFRELDNVNQCCVL